MVIGPDKFAVEIKPCSIFKIDSNVNTIRSKVRCKAAESASMGPLSNTRKLSAGISGARTDIPTLPMASPFISFSTGVSVSFMVNLSRSTTTSMDCPGLPRTYSTQSDQVAITALSAETIRSPGRNPAASAGESSTESSTMGSSGGKAREIPIPVIGLGASTPTSQRSMGAFELY